MKKFHPLWLTVFLTLGACQTVSFDSTPVSDNGAVRALAAQADADLAAGRVVSAGAALERALRIESRNSRLWLKLAELRLAQGDLEQAENIARRAISLSPRNDRLRARAEQLIDQVRAGRAPASIGANPAEYH